MSCSTRLFNPGSSSSLQKMSSYFKSSLCTLCTSETSLQFCTACWNSSSTYGAPALVRWIFGGPKESLLWPTMTKREQHHFLLLLDVTAQLLCPPELVWNFSAYSSIALRVVLLCQICQGCWLPPICRPCIR